MLVQRPLCSSGRHRPRLVIRLSRITGLAIFAVTALTGCGLPIENAEKPNLLNQSLGEPTSDRPAYPERLALYACNRARVEPAAVKWPDFKPVPPLLLHDSLAQSGRAHSLDMRDNGCFQHPSCDGTDTFARIKSFWTGRFSSMGENIAAGVDDGQTVIHNWIDEIGAPPGETGHRENMFSKDYDYVGFGYAEGGSRSFKGYWTQDFAGVGGVMIPRLASGSHFPASINPGGTATFGTVYYDKGGVSPDQVQVVVDGKPFALANIAGIGAAGAYEGDVTLASGCHRYYFRSITGGQVTAYPDMGTLGAGTLDVADCPEYTAGGVSLDVSTPKTGGGGGGSGGCSVSSQRPPAPPLFFAFLLLSLLATPLARRRHARA